MTNQPVCVNRGSIVSVLVILVAFLGMAALLYATFRPASKPPGQAEPRQPYTKRLTFQDFDARSLQGTLVITLHYDTNATPKLVIRSVEKKDAFLPSYQPPSNGYLAQIVDDAGTVLYAQAFAIPDTLHVDPPAQTTFSASDIYHTLTEQDFILSLPASSKAKTLNIKDPSGAVIASQRINLLSLKSSFIGKLSSLFPAVWAADNNGVLDLAFVSVKYTDMAKFNTDTDHMVTNLTNYVPFKDRGRDFKAYKIENTDDLGCKKESYSGTSVYNCPLDKVTKRVIDAQKPYDVIIVLIDDGFTSTTITGEGITPLITLRNRTTSQNPASPEQAFVHEIGHAVGNLRDEYIADSSDGTSDSKTHANCYAGSPPVAEWASLVQTNEYKQGCLHPNWYRSSENSVMNSTNSTSYNKVSQMLLGKALDFYKKDAPTPSASPGSTASPSISPSVSPSASASARPSSSPSTSPSASPTASPGSPDKPTDSNGSWSISLTNDGCTLNKKAKMKIAITFPWYTYPDLTTSITMNFINPITDYSTNPAKSTQTAIDLPTKTQISISLVQGPVPLAPGQLIPRAAARLTTVDCP